MREFHFIDKIFNYKVVPWPYNDEGVELNYRVIYHLGYTNPPGYPDYYGRKKNLINHPYYNLLISDYNGRVNYDELMGLSVGGLYEEYETDNIRIRGYGYQKDRGKELFNNFVTKLIKDKEKYTALEILILGNYYMDDYEHVFYPVNKLNEIIQSFNKLKHLLVRGGFSKFKEKQKMKVQNDSLLTLIVQTMGLSKEWLKAILNYELPNLNHLELYLGTEHYNGLNEIEAITPLLSGQIFPKLKYLGLIDSDISNEISYKIAHSPLIEKLNVLDLSKGLLTDEGAEILLNSPNIKKLKLLDISENHCSNEFLEEIVELSKNKKLNINLIDQHGPIERRYHVTRE